MSIDNLVNRKKRKGKGFSRKATGNPHGFMRSRILRGSLVYIRHCFHQEKLGFDKEKKIWLKVRTLTANIAGSS